MSDRSTGKFQGFQLVMLDHLDFAALYQKAKTSFKNCIGDPDNKFLESQIEVALGDLVAREEWIRVQFFGMDRNSFEIEVRLSLSSPTEQPIGYYCYHESNSGDFIDDYLVFE